MRLKLTAVLFDLDGTLFDTAPDLIFAANSALAAVDIPPRPDTELRPCISGGAAAMLRCALTDIERQGIDFDRLLHDMLERYQTHVADRTHYYDGMEAVLEELENLGLPWGIVTNKTSRFTDPLLKAFNLAERPRCVISGDTMPEKKPHPLPLLEAARRMAQAPENCVYVGDAVHDMKAGQRAGMTTLAALYGYIGENDDPTAWGADGLLRKPRDLLDWLQGDCHP